MDTIKLPLKRVTVLHRGGEIPVNVPEHEIRVLRAVHGPDRVQVEGDAGTGTFGADPADEYMRLQRSYRQAGSPDPVRIAYPEGPSGLLSHGFGVKAKKAA